MAVLAEIEKLHSSVHHNIRHDTAVSPSPPFSVSMDEDLYTEDAGRAHSTGNSWGSEPYAGAFFPRSRNFVVEGGVFTNNVTNVTHNHHTYPPSPDFRKIPMGEIDLQHEIQFDDDSGVVYRRRGQRCARRMYLAKIDGCKTAMTVALYHGPNAEQVRPPSRHDVTPPTGLSQAWQKNILMHSWLRHPNFVQLYGVASTSPIYAAVFHDGAKQFGQFSYS
ncbi:hypothetical protein B0H16DRAFT_737588 [Mycena metata]|uniref:Protein kinase domain-containing protein n=1 Tax=Mycena metata TaxID=1033252 RepID=A0AAD7ND51_9AGAR|nr:hypothetical protein B0H16DRAFT_737588 [Mycena metata]